MLFSPGLLLDREATSYLYGKVTEMRRIYDEETIDGWDEADDIAIEVASFVEQKLNEIGWKERV